MRESPDNFAKVVGEVGAWFACAVLAGTTFRCYVCALTIEQPAAQTPGFRGLKLFHRMPRVWLSGPILCPLAWSVSLTPQVSLDCSALLSACASLTPPRLNDGIV